MVNVTRRKIFELKINNKSRDSLVGVASKIGAGRASDQMPAGFEIFLFSEASRRIVRPAQTIQKVTEVGSLTVRSTG